MQSSDKTNKECAAKGNVKKRTSVDNCHERSNIAIQRNEISSRSASVPSVVYQEDISVKTHPYANKETEPLTTKMRLLITSCDEEASFDENEKDMERMHRKHSDEDRRDSGTERKDSSEKDSLEESEESDWFNSDLSTPEYTSRRNSYNSKRGSLDIYGEMSVNNEPWPINSFSFAGPPPTSLMNPFSPTFGGRKLSGSSYSTASTAASRSSLLNVPHFEDNVFRNDGEGHFIGGVEMRPLSTTSYGPNRRKSTSSLHILQARYR